MIPDGRLQFVSLISVLMLLVWDPGIPVETLLFSFAQRGYSDGKYHPRIGHLSRERTETVEDLLGNLIPTLKRRRKQMMKKCHFAFVADHGIEPRHS